MTPHDQALVARDDFPTHSGSLVVAALERLTIERIMASGRHQHKDF
jgi:hypothetical protein